MNEQDKKIQQLYTEVYDNVHASDDLKGKVTAMKTTKNIKRKIIKTVCVAAAAAVILTAGAMITSASMAEYDTIILNGQEEKARFVDFGTGTRMWECISGNTCYSVYIYGDYDKENNTLYFVDKGDYFLASTDPNPTLNLYTDIDQSSCAEFKEIDNEKYLDVTSNDGTMEILFSQDEEDGTADGVFRMDNSTIEAYTLLPNGSVANTMKMEIHGPVELFKHQSEQFWGDIYAQIDSYKNG